LVGEEGGSGAERKHLVCAVAGGSHSHSGVAGEAAVHPGRLRQSPSNLGKRFGVSVWWQGGVRAAQRGWRVCGASEEAGAVHRKLRQESRCIDAGWVVSAGVGGGRA